MPSPQHVGITSVPTRSVRANPNITVRSLWAIHHRPIRSIQATTNARSAASGQSLTPDPRHLDNYQHRNPRHSGNHQRLIRGIWTITNARSAAFR